MVSWRQREWAKTLLKEEQNYTVKDRGGKISVALVYPNHYFVGMSNLGFQTIYRLFNDRKDIVCERVFLPDFPLSPQEPLVSLESQRPLHDFEIIAFSVSYENDYLNILKILDMAQIPLEAVNRISDHPLIIMGGVCAGFNPEPLARFVDCFLIGEGEAILPDFINQYLASKEDSESKEELLYNLAKMPSFYVPRFYRVEYKPSGIISQIKPDSHVAPHISRALVSNLDDYETTTQVITPNSEFGHMFLIEIGRGCRRSCSFCLMTSLYKPHRWRSLSALLPVIQKGLSFRDTIGLVSASATDHPQIFQICSAILASGGKVSVSSLRLESITDEFLDLLAASGHKTVTLAPEAGSDRLRRYLGKSMREEIILDKVQLITAHGIPNIKLYFMIGLPSETEDDLKAIESLVKRIKHVMLQTARQKAALGNITVSINCFVPKPLSGFERCAMDEVTVLQAKLKSFTKRLKTMANVQVIHDLPKWAFIQGLLVRGDRNVGEILQRVYLAGGKWKSVFKAINLNPEFYSTRARDEEETLPWDLFRTH